MDGSEGTVEVMAKAMISSGIERLFAYPGDPVIDLMERSRGVGIDVVLAQREADAAFMAEGHAMATGRTGAALSTLGPGSTALVNGVAAAYLDRVPMLAISGQIDTSRQQYFTHQVVDHTRLYSSVTKWCGSVQPGSAATIMRKALRTAAAERPGPVHLTINEDLSERPASDAGFTAPPSSSAVTAISVHGTPGAGDGPARILSQAKRPVILAGISAMRAQATRALIDFAEAASIAVVVSPMAKGVMPESHPLFAGVIDMACNDVIWEFLSDADLIVAVGFDAVELIKPWKLKTTVLHVDTVPNTDQIYASPYECIGDISAVLDWLRSDWTGEPRWTAADVAAHRDKLRSAYYQGRLAGVLNPSDVIDSVREAAPADTIATCDVGSHKLLVGQGWQTEMPRGVLMSNGLSSMGFGIPAAIGAKLALPSRPVVAMVGDGGFAMAATEIRVAATHGLGLAVVVFVDGSLNRIELKQMARGYPSTATRFDGMDIAAMAEAMGADGVRVDSAESLDRAVSGIGALSRPLVVAAHIDPSQYQSQF